MRFNYNLQLYIPSENNNNEYINVYATLKNIGINAFTLTKAIGSWNEYTEEINVVEIFIESSADLINIVYNYLHQLTSDLLSYKQEAVSLKVNGKAYIISNGDNFTNFIETLKGDL